MAGYAQPVKSSETASSAFHSSLGRRKARRGPSRYVMAEALEVRRLLTSVPTLANDQPGDGWAEISADGVGQSFLAISDNRLTTVSLYVADRGPTVAPGDNSITISIHQYPWVDDTRMDVEATVTVADGFSGWISLDAANLTLRKGEAYTIVATNDTSRWIIGTSQNRYAGGALLAGDTVFPANDALFRVQWQPNTITPEIDNSRIGVYGWNAAIPVDTPIAQTFTAISNNRMDTVAISLADMNLWLAPNDHSVTVTLYQGAGTSGEVLSRLDYASLTDGFHGTVELSFSDVTLCEGSTYTIAVSNDNVRWGVAGFGNTYAGGTDMALASPIPLQDMSFRIRWQPDTSTPILANDQDPTVRLTANFADPEGQSFVAISNNPLSSASLFIADLNPSAGPGDYSVTLSLYEGAGVTGRLLGSRSYTGLYDGFRDWATVDFSSVTLVKGQTYTLTVGNENGRWAMLGTSNHYAGGIFTSSFLTDSMHDPYFRVQWQDDTTTPVIGNEQYNLFTDTTTPIKAFSPLGQTFTAISNNRLSSVSLYLADMNAPAAPADHSVTISLYEGTGTTRLLGTRDYTALTDGYVGRVDVSFNTVTLVAGRTYTIAVSNDTARWGLISTTNRYAGGTAWTSGAAEPGADAAFRVQWQPDSTIPRVTNDVNGGPPALLVPIQASAPFGQSFTAISNNRLSTASFRVVDMNASAGPGDDSVTISLYEGVGTGGQIVRSRESAPLPNGFDGYTTVDFSDVTLVAGRTYTLVANNDTPRWSIVRTDNQYAGGDAVISGLSTVGDLMFRIDWDQDPATAPSDIQLSNDRIPENQPPGTAVGTLTTIDSDLGDTFTYTLVSGDGSADNAMFRIVGDQLQTNATLDYEITPMCHIRVRSTDSGGLWVEKTFIIKVIDVAEMAPMFKSIDSDTGSSGSDQITSDQTLLIKGVSEPLMTITIYRDGTTAGTTTADLAGMWTFDDSASKLAEGSHTYKATASDSLGSSTMSSTPFVVTIDTAAPVVTAVYVRGTTWNTNYLSFLQDKLSGSSATYGYAVPVGSGDMQLQTLPWRNLNQISVAFSEDVSVSQAQFAIVGSVGSYSVSGFSYNAADHVATWSLSAAMGPDKLYVALPGSGSAPVTDLAGNVLDGEWTNPSSYSQVGSTSSFPSGNGSAGGDFAFRFDVLPGDSTGGSLGKVNVADVAQTKSRSTLAVSSSSYRSDFDGNNLINVADVAYVKSKSSIYSLPVDPPVLPVFGSMFSQVSLLQKGRSLTLW